MTYFDLSPPALHRNLRQIKTKMFHSEVQILILSFYIQNILPLHICLPPTVARTQKMNPRKSQEVHKKTCSDSASEVKTVVSKMKVDKY